MNKDQLLLKLNWFYTLELNQVEWYNSQSLAFQGSYSSKVLERVSAIEKQHVSNIEAVIRKLGHAPTKLGDVLSPIVGSTAGKAISMAGLQPTLKANILLEQKAMSDYAKLIKQIRMTGLHQQEELKHIVTPQGEFSLMQILRSNYIDEDIHTAWFIHRSELSE